MKITHVKIVTFVPDSFWRNTAMREIHGIILCIEFSGFLNCQDLDTPEIEGLEFTQS